MANNDFLELVVIATQITLTAILSFLAFAPQFALWRILINGDATES